MGVIPIVNENDTLAVSEIKFGDNDTLSAITAAMVHADLLFLMTDVDCLYDKNPRTNADAQPIEVVEDIGALVADGLFPLLMPSSTLHGLLTPPDSLTSRFLPWNRRHVHQNCGRPSRHLSRCHYCHYPLFQPGQHRQGCQAHSGQPLARLTCHAG
jgi:hypothetical protein